MSMPFVDLRSQYQAMKSQIRERIDRVLEHGQYVMGPEVLELERRLEDLTHARNCITVASGTEALMISLMAMGVGPGDEVITTPFTFVSTVEVIVFLGAKPVFVDIEADTCNIDAEKIEKVITVNTKAIVPVSLYGQPVDMDKINDIASRYGDIPVIEDAAQSFGAKYKGRKSCNLSTVACTSFFPSKPLGCYGDGGAIFTNDGDIAQACREIRVHGQKERYVHSRIGVGGRMDTLQCAIVLAKLEHFDWEIKKRMDVGMYYNQLLDERGISRVQQRGDRTSVFAQYTMLANNRDRLRESLKKSGIPTAVHYSKAMNQQPAYRHLCCPDCTPISSMLSRLVVSLPMHPQLTREKQQEIVSKIIF